MSSVFGQNLKPLLHDQLFFDKFHMSNIFRQICQKFLMYTMVEIGFKNTNITN